MTNDAHTVVLATRNAGKLRELRRSSSLVFGCRLNGGGGPESPRRDRRSSRSTTFEENASAKARYFVSRDVAGGLSSRN